MSQTAFLSPTTVSAAARRSTLTAGPMLGRLALLLAITIGIAAASGEERASSIGLVRFHIPSQPLIDALQAYGRQAGVQVMFETAAAAGLRSGPVEGEFTPEIALRMLLAETDLKIRYSRATAVTLAPASASNPDAPPALPLPAPDITLETLRIGASTETADRGRLGDYLGTVQADIRKAVQQISRTHQGEYRIAVRLWINVRTVERAELDGSTGDHDRDNRIADVLRGLTLSQQAPPNTPRPMRFMISMRAL
jgi:hypothetical protein